MMVVETYVIMTREKEFYCGKTTQYDKRMKQHKAEKCPHWFGMKKSRKDWKIVFVFPYDIEKRIKSFGVKKFMECLKDYRLRSPLP